MTDEAAIDRYLGDIRSVVGKCVARMPPHADYVARIAQAPPGQAAVTAMPRVRPSLKSIAIPVIGQASRGLDKELPYAGHGLTGQLTKYVGVDGDLPPSQESQLIGLADFLNHCLYRLSPFFVSGQKDHAHTGLRTRVGSVTFKQFPGDLRHDAGSVAGNAVATAGAAVLHAPQGRQTLLQDLVRPKFVLGIGVGNESHSTGIALPRQGERTVKQVGWLFCGKRMKRGDACWRSNRTGMRCKRTTLWKEMDSRMISG